MLRNTGGRSSDDVEQEKGENVTVALLEVEKLSKSYGSNTAVAEVGFHIDKGETYGLLGPNGAGKSTTISIIAGVLKADSGSVRIDGQEHGVSNAATKGQIGFVPQELALYPDLNAWDNLMFFARLYGLSGAKARSRCGEILEIIDLTDRAKENVSTFSGGMSRRLNIGVGMLNRPRLLILDEPAVGVDAQSRNAILESIQRQAADGVSVLYTTHYMEEAERLCDRVGIIDSGRIQAEGTQRELISQVGEDDTIVLSLGGGKDRAVRALKELSEVREVSVEGSEVRLLLKDARSVIARILEVVTASEAVLRSVEVQEPDLEAVFLHLTGKALRE
ncbi:ABC transporter family protein [Nocardiopsis alba ATCC BAA-2165]|uniref:ABC transporter family protein n=1 Tax=Nocardiopsis alba (strain ATCC BAA-2165 / BE74) TaxID=1205910 RepID=J7L0A4_NOCAA|nr:ABC transporter family protein [Nocardiopsis alba ATCC BAA-2165]